jgi:RNA polymerase sigma-70 factor, ECF subfamily
MTETRGPPRAFPAAGEISRGDGMRAAPHRVSEDVEPDRAAETSAGTDAFRRYVVPELPVLLRVARRITGDPTDAEDLVQETLVRAYRAIDSFDGRHPRAWLLTILRNTWRNMNRRARPRLLDSDEDIVSVAATGADGRGGAEEHVLDRVLDAELARALQDLSHKHRAAIVLVDIDGLSYQEAADVLAVPTGTVMSRLHRARQRLRRRLEQRGYSLGVSL